MGLLFFHLFFPRVVLTVFLGTFGAFCGMPVEFCHILFERCPALRCDGETFAEAISLERLVTHMLGPFGFFDGYTANHFDPFEGSLNEAVTVYIEHIA